jgi:Ykl077w/Psg1 (Pma1 Stabilization in Golgi)
LQGLSSNNVTLWINPLKPIDGEAHSLGGLNLEVTNKPADYYRQPKTPVPKGQSLYIALPTVFGFIILCVCGGAIINRKHRKIGLGNVMGRRKGYGVGKSRSQRLGLRKKKEGAIQLRDQELTAGGQYRDVPIPEDGNFGRARADSDALGSLAGTPTEERTNYFRDEMRRQEQNRY